MLTLAGELKRSIDWLAWLRYIYVYLVTRSWDSDGFDLFYLY